jgi:predicted dehydrogenase
VIGAGVISAQHLGFLKTCARARLVGVCDLSRAAARYAAQSYHAEATYTDYRHLLSDAKPDVVHILTPPHTHKAIAIDCLQAGAHVVCEKPITPTHQDFTELWAIAQQQQRVLIEDQNYRFNDPILELQSLVNAGTLGAVQEVEIRLCLDIRTGEPYADENLPSPLHRLPAGALHDFITHLVYLTLLFLPQPFDASTAKIQANWNNHGGGTLFKYDDLDALLIQGQVHARLRFSSYTRPDAFSVTVRGTQGYAETDLFQPYLRCVVPRPGGKQLSPLVNHFLNGTNLVGSSFSNFYRKLTQQKSYEGLARLLDRTYTAILEHQPLPVRFEDMDQTSRLVEALLAHRTS